jgi:hypothetical protein
LEAQLALGKLEVELGYPLPWRVRKEFIEEKMAELRAENKEPIPDN